MAKIALKLTLGGLKCTPEVRVPHKTCSTIYGTHVQAILDQKNWPGWLLASEPKCPNQKNPSVNFFRSHSMFLILVEWLIENILYYFKCLIFQNNRCSIWWCACRLVFVCGWISQMFRWKLSRPTQLWSNRGGINHFQFSRSCYSTNDFQKYCNSSSSRNRPPSQLGKPLLKSGPSIWATPKLLFPNNWKT